MDHTRVKVELLKEKSVSRRKRISLSFAHLCSEHLESQENQGVNFKHPFQPNNFD